MNRSQLLTIVFVSAAFAASSVVSQKSYESMKAQLMSTDLSSRLEPAQVLELLDAMFETAPSAQEKRLLRGFYQFHRLIGDVGCEPDFFVDINAAFEEHQVKPNSNLGNYLEWVRKEEFDYCKHRLELEVGQLGDDASKLTMLAKLVVEAGPGVQVNTLTIPPLNIPSGIVNYLRASNMVQVGLNEAQVGQLVQTTVGELCRRISSRLEPAMEVYKVGSSYRQLFKQDSEDEFVWTWLFNMQVCKASAGSWVIDAIYDSLKSNSGR